ncbi:hypothetical protein [Roseateles sp. P5_E1]
MKNPSCRLARCLALIVSLVACSAASAQSLEIKWLGEGRYTRTVKVQPAKTYEFCGELKANQKLIWSFESSQTLSYAIYQMDGSHKTPVGASTDGWRANGKVEAPSAGRYCWTWTNGSDKAIELAFDLKPQP